MNMIIRFFFTVLVITIFLQQPCSAGTILGTNPQQICLPQTSVIPLEQVIGVYGDWIETIGTATSTDGNIRVRIIDKLNGLQNNTDPFKGRGKVTLGIQTQNVTPGNKTITLSGGLFGQAAVTITVVAPPTVTSVSAPTPAEPFSDIEVTLNGTGLQGAVDPGSGSIVRNDSLVPFVTVGGNVDVTDVRVLSSTNTSIRAKVFFSGLVQDVSVDLSFKPATSPPQPCLPLFNKHLTHRVHVKTTSVKNYVEAFAFPAGRTFAVNSTGTISLNLLFPAPGVSGVPSSTIKTKQGLIFPVPLLLQVQASARDNSRVFFNLIPAGAFDLSVDTRVQTLNDPLHPGIFFVDAHAGDDIVPFSFKVKDCGGGPAGQPNVVRIQTWMHNLNTNLSPDFVTTTFNLQCVQ